MKHKWFACIGVFFTACMGSAQQVYVQNVAGEHVITESKPASLPGPSGERRYRLLPGDSFDVDFALSPEFNQTISVQPDGYGTLKGVGSIRVQGKTVPELAEAIREAYASVLHEPRIAIALKDFDKPSFLASGQVGRPGKYDLRSDLTVSEGLAVAGGVTEKGKVSEVILYRKSPDGSFQGKVLNLKKLLAAHNLSEDPHLQPGDMLYVPTNISSQIRPYLPTTSAGAFYNPIHQ